MMLLMCPLYGGCVYWYLYMITSTDMSQLRRGWASNCHSENVNGMFCVNSEPLAEIAVMLGA